MKLGPKYKIARRLGAPVFEKTQTAKYTLSLARKERAGMVSGRPKSEFGQALTEKQKARFTYGITEKQFKNYVSKASKSANPAGKLYALLETRLDNALFRSGLAKTRSAARQIASHGHVTVNGRRVTVPSIALSTGDVVAVRAGSSGSALFADAAERMKAITAPAWIELRPEEREFRVKGEPVYDRAAEQFDLGVVIGFYNR
jgi:small subunit ribosomal protein S4